MNPSVCMPDGVSQHDVLAHLGYHTSRDQHTLNHKIKGFRAHAMHSLNLGARS